MTQTKPTQGFFASLTGWTLWNWLALAALCIGIAILTYTTGYNNAFRKISIQHDKDAEQIRTLNQTITAKNDSLFYWTNTVNNLHDSVEDALRKRYHLPPLIRNSPDEIRSTIASPDKLP